jgi:hypothetical protein
MHSLGVLIVESGDPKRPGTFSSVAWRCRGVVATRPRSPRGLEPVVATRHLGELDRARDLLLESLALARQASDQVARDGAQEPCHRRIDGATPEFAVGLIEEGREVDARLGDTWARRGRN